MKMLYHSIIRQDSQAILLKTEQAIMSFTDTKRTFTYDIYMTLTGYWYSLKNLCPANSEQDELAIEVSHNMTQGRGLPLLPPVNPKTERRIRDFYLKKTHDDNFVLFDYRDHHIWFGYNETNKHGIYFVTDADGNELDSFSSIRDARFYIDQVFEGVNNG
jgi:hypothetical protein